MNDTFKRRLVRTCAGTTLALLSALSATGCSLAGSWQTVSVEPLGLPFPLEAITLDNDNNYTATWAHDGQRRTTTGRFKWNGRSLELARQGFSPRKYRAKKRLDGKLVMYFEQNDVTMTAILEKQPTPK